jgi:hypothetical protein
MPEPIKFSVVVDIITVVAGVKLLTRTVRSPAYDHTVTALRTPPPHKATVSSRPSTVGALNVRMGVVTVSGRWRQQCIDRGCARRHRIWNA